MYYIIQSVWICKWHEAKNYNLDSKIDKKNHIVFVIKIFLRKPQILLFSETSTKIKKKTWAKLVRILHVHFLVKVGSKINIGQKYLRKSLKAGLYCYCSTLAAVQSGKVTRKYSSTSKNASNAYHQLITVVTLCTSLQTITAIFHFFIISHFI